MDGWDRARVCTDLECRWSLYIERREFWIIRSRLDGSGSNGWPNQITENIEGIFEVDPDPTVTTEHFGFG
mgnify:CR=1 FL=1